MSIKISHIEVSDGDSVFLQCNGSVELSILVTASKEKGFIVSGPMNRNSREFKVTVQGIRKIKQKKQKTSIV